MVVNGTTEPIALRPREAAALLGISQRFLWDLTKQGDVPCVRVGKGKRPPVLYPVAALQEWLAGNAQPLASKNGGAN